MKKMNTTKSIMVAVTAAVVAIGALVGCGNVVITTETTHETTTEAVNETVDEAEETTVATPFLADLEKYDSVISGLNSDQYYAFAAVGDEYDLLLVTDSVYDYGDGVMAAIDATVYGFDADGNAMEFGIIESEGTAYPISVSNGCLMYGGNHHVAKTFCASGSMITKMDASEVFDEEGNATYYIFDYDNMYEGEADDNTALMALYDEYATAVVINFTQAE